MSRSTSAAFLLSRKTGSREEREVKNHDIEDCDLSHHLPRDRILVFMTAAAYDALT